MDRPVGICEASGFKFPLDELVRQWDGAMVHRRFADRRNTQDFVQGRKETIGLPVSRLSLLTTSCPPNEVTPNDL